LKIEEKCYRVSINKNLCKDCFICVKVCPKKVFDIKDGDIVYVKDENMCIGCKICENLCPDFAIEVMKR